MGLNSMSEVEEDRISNLPASLLHHVLSFVDTRDASRTTVLSKRWKYIWRSIHILRFRCHNSLQIDRIIDFVDTTLEFHDELNIQEFSFESRVLLNESRVKKWITTLIGHNVEYLRLQLNQTDPVLIPSSLFSCESSLVYLVFFIRPVICFPKYISFPRLKTLKIFGVEFSDECWNEQLFSNCPVLNLLKMIYCTWSDMRSFCISNPALKYLFIVGPEEVEDGLRNCAIQIHAPSLEFLTFEGKVAKDYILSSFPALVKAKVDFYVKENGAMWDYGAVVSKFFQALANVVHLTISDQTLQVLFCCRKFIEQLPSFHNLYMLVLTQKLTADKALIALLKKAPNLVSLKFEVFVSPFPGEEDDNVNAGDDGGEKNHNIEEVDPAEGEYNTDNEDDGWALDMVVTRCSFLQYLKVVTFMKFTGNTREMRWLQLVLNNVKALEAIDICFDSISHGKSKKLLANISNLPRASASCVFKFSSEQV